MVLLEALLGKSVFVGAPILLGVVMALTTALNWPKWLNYVWAAMALVFGAVAYVML